jgi:hypothetical protein
LPRIVGRVVDVEDVAPYVVPATGEVRGEPHTRLHVLEGRNVYVLRIGPEFGPAPSTDSEIDAEVTVRAYKNRDGAAQISYTAVKRNEPGSSGRRAMPQQATA